MRGHVVEWLCTALGTAHRDGALDGRDDQNGELCGLPASGAVPAQGLGEQRLPTNTGPLVSPTGESMPATGKSVRFRACDLATVEDGVIASHRHYFDQMEFLAQLGLMEAPA